MASTSAPSGPARLDRSTECGADGGQTAACGVVQPADSAPCPFAGLSVHAVRRFGQNGERQNPVERWNRSSAAARLLPGSCRSAACQQVADSNNTGSPQQAGSKAAASGQQVHSKRIASAQQQPATPTSINVLRAWNGDAPVADIGFGKARRKKRRRHMPLPEAPIGATQMAENTLDHLCAFSRPSGLMNQALNQAFCRRRVSGGNMLARSKRGVRKTANAQRAKPRRESAPAHQSRRLDVLPRQRVGHHAFPERHR